ncbi:hypothetical protein [Sulfitobacter geojensis]|uniref:hypothetical protein n=1 Tax=Sulfitobacter geojensis TaxID=1342299 RepID=UPI003F5CCAAA
MKTNIIAHVALTFESSAPSGPADQRSMIEDDIGRLTDADSTSGVACTGFSVTSIETATQNSAVSRTHVICATCGSESVRADAYASWDADTGEWVLHSIYDEKYCEVCETSTSLLEVDEATGLEVQAFGMIYCDDGARLVQGREQPEFYDLIVKTMAVAGGEILTLHEFDDMNRLEVEKCLADMAMLYPSAPVSCFFGDLVGSGRTNLPS